MFTCRKKRLYAVLAHTNTDMQIYINMTHSLVIRCYYNYKLGNTFENYINKLNYFTWI